MNREIKFRAWDLVKGKMRHVSFIEFDGADEIATIALLAEARNTKQGYSDRFEERQNGEDLILMQYTGIKDTNRRLIYEGDIVKNTDDKVGRIVWAEKYCTDNEYNEDIMGWCADVGTQYWALDPQGTYEVIGNIYENSDLLQ